MNNQDKKVDKYNRLRDEKGRYVIQKWTEDAVSNKLIKIHKSLDADLKKPIGERKYKNMLDIMVDANVSDVWLERMRKRYNDNEEITEGIDLFRLKCEKRVWDLTADSSINPYLGLFSLKAYHNRVEKQYVQTDNNNYNQNQNINLNINYPNNNNNKDDE